MESGDNVLHGSEATIIFTAIHNQPIITINKYNSLRIAKYITIFHNQPIKKKKRSRVLLNT